MSNFDIGGTPFARAISQPSEISKRHRLSVKPCRFETATLLKPVAIKIGGILGISYRIQHRELAVAKLPTSDKPLGSFVNPKLLAPVTACPDQLSAHYRKYRRR